MDKDTTSGFIDKCPFCKSDRPYAFSSDFHDADGPLYWTVLCPDCKAHGPMVQEYGTDDWSEERRRSLDTIKSGIEREYKISEINRRRAIAMWNDR
jgi:hypothetical protein